MAEGRGQPNEEHLHDDLLNHLVVIRSNFSFGLRFWALLKDAKTASKLEIHRIVVRPDGVYAIPPGKTLKIPEGESFYALELGGPKARDFQHASMEFVKLHLRVFVVEAFEKLKSQCKIRGRLNDLKQCPWYQFARMVRNALAHDQHWDFRKYDRPILPVSWNKKIIEAHFDGTEMGWDFFDPYDALELWDEMYAFARGLSNNRTEASP